MSAQYRSEEIVRRSLARVGGAAGECEVELEAQVEELTVAADGGRVVQTLVDLIESAIELSDTGGVVMVRVNREGDVAHFWVSDRGRGVPSGQLDSVLRRHGGRVRVDSEEGVGATFSFVVPLADAVGAA